MRPITPHGALMRSFVLMLLVATVALLALPAAAQGRRQRGPNPARQAEALSERLGLDEDQKAELQTILEGRAEQMRSLRDEAKAEGADRKAVREQMKAVAEEWNEKIEGVFDEEQLAAYHEMRDARELRMREMRERRGKRGKDEPNAEAP